MSNKIPLKVTITCTYMADPKDYLDEDIGRQEMADIDAEMIGNDMSYDEFFEGKDVEVEVEVVR